MNTLQRYIFRRVAVIALGSFFAVLCVIWVTQIMTRIDFATWSGQSTFAFVKLAATLTPQLAALVLPIGIAIGVVQVFTTMNADSELAVMSASGASRGMIAWPVLVVAAIASVYILFSNHIIEPRANRALRDLLVSARADLLTSVIREGVFTNLDRDLTIYIDKRLPGNALSGIMVSDTRDDNFRLLYYAQSGAIGTVDGRDVIVMTNGQIQRKNLTDGSLSVIRFNSYAMNLSQFASAASTAYYIPPEMETATLLEPDHDDKWLKVYPGWYAAELHRRFSDWLYPFLFAYLALVIAGQTQSHRQTRFNAFFLAVGGTLVYRWGAYAIYNATRVNGDLWWALYALPILATMLGWTMYRFGITVAVPDRVAGAFDRLWARFSQWRVRTARARAT